MMEKVYLTHAGYEKLSKELEYLKGSKRREVAAALAHARSLGDLSENAEYDAAKAAFAENEQRIQDLEDKLTRVEIIDDVNISLDKAYLGARLKLVDLDNNEEMEYKLVGPDETNPLEGMISISSPVGKALLGKSVGEEVAIQVPAGALRYKILGISR